MLKLWNSYNIARGENEVSDKFLTPSTRTQSVGFIHDTDSLAAFTVPLFAWEPFLKLRLPRNTDKMALYNGVMNITDGTGYPSILSRTPRSVDERLGEFFTDGRSSVFTDADLAQISSLLENSNLVSYSRTPRLYSVLRIINHLELLDEFLASNITDVCFPFNATSFPCAVSSKIQTEFLQQQSTVLTNILHLEKGEKGGHLYFEKGKSAPYEVKGRLGSGSYGEVQKVVSLLSHEEFARKLVRRTKYRRKNEPGIKTFLAELQVLKRISHYHTVKLVCAFTS